MLGWTGKILLSISQIFIYLSSGLGLEANKLNNPYVKAYSLTGETNLYKNTYNTKIKLINKHIKYLK